MEWCHDKIYMRALIYAAGFGTRLGRLTKKVPKPMVDVCGKPCLEHIIDDLNRQGVYEIIVNLHYLPNKIMKHFGSKILYFYESKILGEEKTLSTLVSYFPTWGREYLVVKNGDTLTDVKLTDMIRMSSGASIKHMDFEKGVYAGTTILAPEYFINNKIVNSYYNKETFWVDIGTPEGLRKAREIYSHKSQERQYN